MSQRESKGRPSAPKSRFAGLVAWLSAYPRCQWAIAKARRVQIVLTAALLVTGLTAWALAIVQPWTNRSDAGPTIAGPSGFDTGKIRSMSVALEKLFGDVMPQASKPLRRNPFASPDGAQESVASPPSVAPAEPRAGQLQRQLPQAVRPESPAAAAPSVSPPAVLEAAKRMRLEVILITPAGDRWAVINGQNCREGDAVAGFRIVEIQEGKVKLQQAGTICLLRMQ